MGGARPLLAQAGLTVIAPLVGEYVTSLDMAGCSLTMTWLDEELERYWRAPVETAALRHAGIMGEPDTTGSVMEEAPLWFMPRPEPRLADVVACAWRKP
ncbi:dihydroxyacetone kinase subunit DhaK [Komagataeibacter nataicola]|nr:dihydroxyacetone kinase subunit DhaK [Komagataeibacter nataicola]WNM08581.1 dihydroxyacetone kinase subunit DhaK [Komagataeibacter nataicola]